MSDLAALTAVADRIAASVESLATRVAALEAAKDAAVQAAIIPDAVVNTLSTAADTLDAQIPDTSTAPAPETPVP